MDATIKVLADLTQVDIGSMTAQMRVQFFQSLALNIKQRNMISIENVTLQFVENIQDDITSLDEKSAVDLMNSLNSLITNTNASNKVKSASTKLQQTVHEVVS